MLDLKLGKLVSGEIVIGKQIENKLVECYLVQAIPNQQDRQSFSVALLPVFIPVCRDAVNINLEKFICIHEAPVEIANEYQRITSNIIIPQANMPKDFKGTNVTPINRSDKRPIL